MEKTLKEKTTSALIWSFVDKFGQQFIYLATGIVLGRILSPADYGLIGALTLFIALSNLIIGSGYARALLNKPEIKQEELNTLFYYNIASGSMLYILLFFSAPLISRFFRQPELTTISRVLFVSIVFYATINVQDLVITKKMDLKKWAKANLFSLLPASLCAITAACCGWGVWSLLIQALLLSLFKVVTYWHYGGWRPTREVRFSMLKELFPFSSRMLSTSLITTVFNNLYSVLIGRLYNIVQLGFYTQASKYQDIPAGLIGNTFRSVSVPLLSGVNQDQERLKRVLSKLVKTIAFITFPALSGMVLIAKPLFIVLITEKWLPSVPIFQILCVSGIFLTLNNVVQEAILAKGHSGKLLALEILKKMVFVILILLTFKHGVTGLAAGLAASSFFTLLLTLHLSTRLVGYTFLDFLKDCFPYLVLSLFLCAAAGLTVPFIHNNYWCLMVCVGMVVPSYLLLCRMFKLEAFEELAGWVFAKRSSKKAQKTDRP